jgi:hypothetical protein
MSRNGKLVPLVEASAELFGGVPDATGKIRASEAANLRLRRMVHRGDITGKKIGDRIFIPRQAIDDLTA